MSNEDEKIKICLDAAEKAVLHAREKLYIGSDNNISREITEFADSAYRLSESGLASAAGAFGLAIAVGGAAGAQLRWHGTKHQIMEEIKRKEGPPPKRPEDWEPFILASSRIALDAHAGNCGEHASVAFLYLRDNAKDARPIEFMEFDDRSHTFVIINRPQEIPIENFRDWSGRAVLCDPWKGGSGMAEKLYDWYGYTKMVCRWLITD